MKIFTTYATLIVIRNYLFFYDLTVPIIEQIKKFD